MARRFECDRCGNIGRLDALHGLDCGSMRFSEVNLTQEYIATNNDYDLCTKCASELSKWLTSGKVK